MNKSDLRILILEDDPSLGRAVEEALKRAGYSTQIAGNYAQAKSATQFTDFHGLVADCMLPQKSGVEVTQELLATASQDLVVVLTSGIFKDKAYALEAQTKTRAKAFLQKPFDIHELVKIFDEAFRPLTGEAGNPLYQVLTRVDASARDKVAAIKSAEFVHGFDLPYVYTMLADKQISGDLEIFYEDRPKAVIGFQRGMIDKVILTDSESYFGALLIEKGFVTAEELQEALEQKGSQPIGAKLVDNATLSPHAVDVIQHEQMVIRISKTIRDDNVKITFTEVVRPDPKVYLDGYLLSQLLSDWICSKIEPDWLMAFYTPWLESPIVQGPEWAKLGKVRNLAAPSTFCGFIERAWPENVHQLLQNGGQEEEFLRGLHFLLLQRIVVFSGKSDSSEKFDVKISRLSKVWENFQVQNFFEILGVNVKAKSSDIHRAYHELAKNLHPDKLSPQSPPELRHLAQNVFSKVTEAYQTLSNDKRRKDYQKVLEMGEAEEILKAEASFEQALSLLRSNQFRDARKLFETTMELKGHRSDAVVYYIWALIKEKRNRMKRADIVTRVQPFINQIAHEDRHSANYFFIKGMYYELDGQIQKSYQHLKHCISIDPDFIDAKREITYIKKTYANQSTQKSFSDELSTVVTKFFKKKSG